MDEFPDDPDLSKTAAALRDWREADLITRLHTSCPEDHGRDFRYSGQRLFDLLQGDASASGYATFQDELEFRAFLLDLIDRGWIVEANGRASILPLADAMFAISVSLSAAVVALFELEKQSAEYFGNPPAHDEADAPVLLKPTGNAAGASGKLPNRLRIINCGICKTLFALPSSALIEMFEGGIPLTCPFGHKLRLTKESISMDGLTLYDAQVLG